MASEEFAFVLLIVMLISLFVSFFYPYLLARYLITKDINKIWIIIINSIFVIYFILGSSYWNSINFNYSKYASILMFLRIFYVFIPFCYYNYLTKFKNNQPRLFVYIMICVLNFIVFLNTIH